MYLSKFCIKNFRCFNEQGVEIDFRPGINVIIGENNTGKSALIDALRLVFSSGPGRREIYVTPQDFYVHEDGIAAEEIAFDLTFSDLSDAEEAGFYEMLVIKEPMEAQFHIRYRKEKGSDRIRTSLWGGEKEGQPVSSQTLELINHTFLGALRDAERHLRPGRGSHIGQLIRKLVTVEEEKDNILKHMKRANRSILQEKNIKRSNNIINTNLNDIYGARLVQQVNLGFVPPDFGDVVDLLRPLLHPSRDSKVLAAFTLDEWDDLLDRCSNGVEILKQKAQAVDGRVFINLLQISENEQEVIQQNTDEQIYAELEEHIIGVFGLEQNGMGYNNIIYMGTVLGDLQERKNIEKDSYNALLIEEPEAHLHPQLLDLVFNFLGRVSKKIDPPPIQLFITSHSPTLTSRADLDSLIMLYEHEDNRKTLPLNKCPLEPSHKADLQRYLDVTKSQLFFAKGVILVEGISEALLLPILAQRLERCLDQNAVEIVNVSGTSFPPFARLFNAECPEARIEIPCGILTDDDRCTAKEDPSRLTEQDLNISFAGKTQADAPEMRRKLDALRTKLQQGEESARASNARKLENGNLIVRVAYKTFEYELARIPENIAPMLEAIEKIHSAIVKGLRALFQDESFDSDHKAICVWLAVKDAKAEFAQRLAALKKLKNCPHNFSVCRQLKERFRRKGFATQADANYWAMKILETYPRVAKALARRFPEIIIDEAQDSSDIQMRIFDLLVEHGLSEIMLVGDPDQAIYEWRDAKPEVFVEKVHAEGWKKAKYLTENRRSSQHICNATKGFSRYLREPSTAIGDHANCEIRPKIIEYDPKEFETLTNTFITICHECDLIPSPQKTAILVSTNRILRKILGIRHKKIDPWNHDITRLLAQAAYHYHQRHAPKQALASIQTIAIQLYFDNVHLSRRELEKQINSTMGVSRLWQLVKRLPHSDLQLSAWISHAKGVFQNWIEENGWPVLDEEDTFLKVKQGIGKHKDKEFLAWPVSMFFTEVSSERENVRIETVYAAKGKTYEAVLFVVSDTRSKKGKAEQLAGPDGDEEVRTAYVAMTRPRKLLVVAIPKDTKREYLSRFSEWMKPELPVQTNQLSMF